MATLLKALIETEGLREAGWRSLYPFESHWLNLSSGSRLHYLDEGAGEPLLLVHGNPTWSFYWRELIHALHGSYRLIAPDHIGCGLSDKPQRYRYTLERRITDLVDLIEHLDLRQITLVAQDWGGAIGMGAATRMPARFSRFVLSNTGAFRSRRMPWRIRVCRTPILGPLALRGLGAFSRAAVRMAVAHPKRLSRGAKAGYLTPYDSWDNRVAVNQFVQDIPMGPTHRSYEALLAIEQQLAGLSNRPTLLLWGMRDWCFSPHFLDRFLDFFPSAEVVRLADAGHWALEDAPQEFVAAVRDFLHRNRLTPLDQSIA